MSYSPFRSETVSASFGNLWSLTVLCLLREQPMHPYQMQKLILERHNEDFLSLKRGSLYHAISRLRADGLIDEVATSREGRRPERTVYAITADGEAHVLEWLRHLLATPIREPSSFVAALSFLPHLDPEEAADHLELRSRALECELVALDALLKSLQPQIGRLCLIEVEYAAAMKRAERDWIDALRDELREGRLAWSPQELLDAARGPESPHRPDPPGPPHDTDPPTRHVHA
ncbi:MAG: helix-turn-helix transcriptional regulator [Planctomyces sp.]|nr:helix-turn-helix transcriptional regulator [Planctomyces sp.]